MKNELDDFLSGIPSADGSLLEKEEKKPEETVPPEKAEVTPEEGESIKETPEVRKNRRERRAEEKMRQKDEMLIALNNRIIELTSKPNTPQSTTSDMPSEWVALMGDSPEAQRAWKLQEQMLQKATERAKEEAVKEFENKQQKALEEQRQSESFIDSQLEAIEDQHDVDLTSNAPAARKARREFLELVQSLSPKDSSGGIIGFADFGSTFELYQKTKVEKPNETVQKQKEIASKSMTPSGAVDTQKEEADTTLRWLRENGIRV